MVDHGRQAGIGRTNHRSPGFQRASLCQLQVLPGSIRVAEPRHVADVGQQGRLARRADQLFAEAVLVADVEGHALSGQRHRRLVGAARGKAGQRHVHVAVQPAGQPRQRNELAERHQVVLAVALLPAGHADHAVVVAVAIAPVRHAGHQLGPARLDQLAHRLQVLGRHLVVHQREGGFRQHDQFAARGHHLLRIDLQRQFKRGRVPFHRLRDRTLGQRHGQRRPHRTGPLHPGERRATSPQHGDQPGRQCRLPWPAHRGLTAAEQRQQPAEHRATGRHRPADTEDAEHRRIAGQRAIGNLRIAERAPRETGDQPAAYPLEDRPQRRPAQQPGAAATAAGLGQPRRQRRGDRRKQRQPGRQQQGQRAGEHRRQAGNVVQAQIGPVEAGGKAAQRPQIGQHEGAAGTGGEHLREQDRQQRQDQPAMSVRCEGGRIGETDEAGEQKGQQTLHGWGSNKKAARPAARRIADRE